MECFNFNRNIICYFVTLLEKTTSDLEGRYFKLAAITEHDIFKSTVELYHLKLCWFS